MAKKERELCVSVQAARAWSGERVCVFFFTPPRVGLFFLSSFFLSPRRARRAFRSSIKKRSACGV